jgi:thiosulfate/3-mercaptopyruvate sulfurtransferase
MQFARHRVKLGFMEFQTLIGTDSLQRELGNPALAVIDCRFDLLHPDAGREAYLKAHILGARYADLNRDLAAAVQAHTGRHPLPAPEAFARRMGALGIGHDSQVVAYDEANGSFAARLWWLLRWIGHDRVAVLDGGFKAWLARGGEVQSGDTLVPARHLGVRLQPHAVSSSDEVATALKSPDTLLLDARAAERFAGSVEPIDPVAGHIPGAVNHPFSANLEADGRFLPRDELERRWRARLGSKTPENVIAMCGSGVTACHNLLSLELAGLPGGKLFAGSWSEWIRDPRRPVARG